MEQTKEKYTMLNLMTQPAFSAGKGIITQVNDAAAGLLLMPGMELAPLLLTGQEELADLREGCLYLKLNLAPEGLDASVTPMDGELIFLVDAQVEKELQSFSLASRVLRSPMTGMMISASHMHTHTISDALQNDLNQLTKNLHQTLRLLGNMSDAGYRSDLSRQESIDICALFDEVFQKAQAYAAVSGIQLTYQGLDRPVHSLGDAQQLERAALNILSNAMKFTPAGGHVHASLTQKGQTLRLQISDTGCGIPDDVRSSLFCRYRRPPGIEDSRCGMGLGMVIVRNTAASHGGTVLVDCAPEGGTRVTLTLTIRKPAKCGLHSPKIRMDYAGEWDHTLVELADVLPPECYHKEV